MEEIKPSLRQTYGNYYNSIYDNSMEVGLYASST